MKSSKYFRLEEFQCKCGNCKMPQNVPPDKLVEKLEDIREHFAAPLIIRSGYRCKEHNARVGGAPSSRHLKGDAVDFIVQGVPTAVVYEYVEKRFSKDLIGLAIKHNASNKYAGFVHLDTRGKNARWEYK